MLNPSCLLICFPLGQHQLTVNLPVSHFLIKNAVDETAFPSSSTPDESTMLDRSKRTIVYAGLEACAAHA